MSRRDVMVGFVLVALGGAILVGCGESQGVTRKNYDKIYLGMSLADVEKLLGQGQEEVDFAMAPGGRTMMVPGIGGVLAGANVYSWQEEGKVIRIVFVKGRLSTKTQTGL